MPVRKFRTLDEAARSLWLEPGDPRIWDCLVRRWQLHRFFTREPPMPRARGVFKYRSIDEKQRAQDREQAPAGTALQRLSTTS